MLSVLTAHQKNQNLCFSSRPFVLCGLPVRRLPSDQLLYERRNGKFVLQVTEMGLDKFSEDEQTDYVYRVIRDYRKENRNR